jgi:hypothetical protein
MADKRFRLLDGDRLLATLHRRFCAAVCAAIAVTAMLSCPSTAAARIFGFIPCDEQVSKSDLIVVARPLTKTTDTGETTFFDNIVTAQPGGSWTRIKAIGVETTFKVILVLKGHMVGGRFVLHHLRDAQPTAAVPGGGENLVSFDPSNGVDHREVALFLVKEKDGRYAPYGGQTDPGFFSVFAIEPPNKPSTALAACMLRPATTLIKPARSSDAR